MIHYESSIMRHSLCYTFSSKLSHFWGHIRTFLPYLDVLNVGAPNNAAPEKERSKPFFERFFLSIRSFRGSSLLQTHAERLESPSYVFPVGETSVGHDSATLTITQRSEETS